MSIKVLSEDVILKIAAGEVIERPASVVKELIENSIDAGATTISVEFDTNFIKILDDGCGMSEDDLKKCHLRHATSKLSSGDDLFNIQSLGFRGEALASVGAVSLLEITSNVKGESPNKIILEAAREISFGPAAFPYNSGTQIEVKNLFFNTPARKKFMKSETSEVRVITEIIGNYMLAHLNIGFKLICRGKIVINVPASANLEERFYQMYSKDAKQMISLDECPEETRVVLSSKGIHITGLISNPSIYRKTRADQIIFVNGRLIKSAIIYSAISNAYKGYLNTGEQPLGVFKIDIDPKFIDVNVHPTKQEIKFEDDQTIYRAIYYTILDILKSKDLTREAEITVKDNQEVLTEELDIRESSSEVTSSNTTYENMSVKSISSVSYSKPTPQMILSDGDDVIQSQCDVVDEVITKNNSSLKIIGIYHNEFILTENLTNGKLAIVDFHAAAEIANYEKLTKAYSEDNVRAQSLVEPELLEVSIIDSQVLKTNAVFFNKLGFSIEEFGDTSFLLRSVPILLGRQLDTKVLFDLVEGIKAEKQTNSIEDLKDKIITRMACRASEKAGDELTLKQAQNIIDRMFSNEGNSYNCPHGRPTIVELSKEDLEKMFKRIR